MMGPNSKLAKELCEKLGIPYKLGSGFATFNGKSLEGADFFHLFEPDTLSTPCFEDVYVTFQCDDFDMKEIKDTIKKSFVVDEKVLSAA